MFDTYSTPPAITTTLIHRVQRGHFPWWRHAVACDVAGGVDHSELAELSTLVMDMARVGFNSVIIRPARTDFVADASPLEAFIRSVHRTGLKVIVRLSGATSPYTSSGPFQGLEHGLPTLIVRARAALKAGADGIDLGIMDEGDAACDATPRGERFTQMVQLLQAELADFDSQPILSGEALLADPRAYQRHLEEEWFHHLRDDCLVTAPWDAGVLREQVRLTLADRDALGHVAAWHWSHTVTADLMSDFDPGSWQDGATEARRAAMALYSLSLPGAANVPFSHIGGRDLELPNGHRQRTWGSTEVARAEARMLAHALRLRTERTMGTGSLAFIDNLEWAPPGVGVHVSAGIMVVLNSSANDVEVPAEHRVLLSTSEAEAVKGQPTIVPPESCAWFETATVSPLASTTHYC